MGERAERGKWKEEILESFSREGNKTNVNICIREVILLLTHPGPAIVSIVFAVTPFVHTGRT